MRFFTQTYENNIWKYYAFEFFRQFFFIGGVLIIFFTDWGGISQTQIQILQSWYMLALFILEVPTGVIADYWGRKHSLILAGLTMSFAVVVYGIYPNIYLFFLGELFFALSGALRSGANEALIYDSLKELKREKEAKIIMARGEAARKIAIGTSAIIGGYIAK